MALIQPAPPGHYKRVAVTLILVAAGLFVGYRLLKAKMPGLFEKQSRIIYRE